MSDTREWWGEDVMPRIRWRIVVDALTLRRKEVAEDGVFPPGYGLAWLLYDRPGAVCMPIPLNAICGWLRWAWIELCHGLGVKPDRRIVMAVVAAESRAWRVKQLLEAEAALKALRVSDTPDTKPDEIDRDWLIDADVAIARAQGELQRLMGGGRFQMSIPVRQDDSDVLISEAFGVAIEMHRRLSDTPDTGEGTET